MRATSGASGTAAALVQFIDAGSQGRYQRVDLLTRRIEAVAQVQQAGIVEFRIVQRLLDLIEFPLDAVELGLQLGAFGIIGDFSRLGRVRADCLCCSRTCKRQHAQEAG